MIFVITSPSGGGKTTIVNQLMATGEFVRPVTHTTRAPRSIEMQGVSYHFVSRDEFDAKVARGEMIESAEVYGNLYGTSKEELTNCMGFGKHVLIILDVQGAANLKSELGAGCRTVFLVPPSIEVLESRLRARWDEADNALKARLESARKELSCASDFDHIVVNENLDEAVLVVHNIVRVDDLEKISAPTI